MVSSPLIIILAPVSGSVLLAQATGSYYYSSLSCLDLDFLSPLLLVVIQGEFLPKV